MMTINDILAKITVIKFIGNKHQEIKTLVQTEQVGDAATHLCWCSDKNKEQLKSLLQGTIICSNTIDEQTFLNATCNYIVVENPRLAFKQIIELFFLEKETSYEIEKTAFIHPQATIAKNVKIGHHAVIEQGVTIDEFTVIGANTVILKNTEIGKRVKIGCNTTIGGVGFGYEKNEDNHYELIPHIGKVVIEDDVEIGNNVAIDRAVLGSTILRKNVKIDNLVHIAHGVDIGENSLIIAHAMIAGSVKIGKNVWVAPAASVLNKKTISDNAVIGMGAVVLKDVAANDVIVGNPGKSIKKKEHE
jgi:UDP-3-O-[3-hydroxymyristoyl] glucosamine N-acyltransferase